MLFLCALQRRLTEEYERCQHYLDVITRKPLIAAVEAQLLERHVASILEKGFDALMADQRVPDLARLYNLCGRIHALDSLKAAFKAYIKKAGLALVMDEEKVGFGCIVTSSPYPLFQVCSVYREASEDVLTLHMEKVIGGKVHISQLHHCSARTMWSGSCWQFASLLRPVASTACSSQYAAQCSTYSQATEGLEWTTQIMWQAG